MRLKKSDLTRNLGSRRRIQKYLWFDLYFLRVTKRRGAQLVREIGCEESESPRN